MPEAIYEKLINRIRSYHPSDDLSMVEKAYKLAKEAHEGQLRKSGEPYIIHPLQVAYILADLELDIESITAGILHDVVEDTDYTLEDIERLFNKEVALLVDGVTKLGVIKYASSNVELQKEEIQAENYRKMFLAMAQDIRVVLIKLADRLHNMQTLKFMPPHKQKRIAEETLTIYAPIAHRLGICKIKAELEDLSLRYIEPEIYYDLAQKISKKRSERLEYIEQIVKQIREKLDEANIECTVEGRPKHFFSIYKKIVNKNKTLDQIYDLFAVRAIVKNVKDCYGVLGIIHELYTPIPGRFKDYIAMPKSNMYQSLHTTLMGSEGTPFEIQIRTEDMHRTAEYGIAAHWKYKDGDMSGSMPDKSEEKLVWLKQILEWQRDMDDNTEFMNALKLDLDIYTDQVYIFTPKGELITLPKGSTPIDYAYSIHSDIGNKMVGAKVNGKIVKVDYVIKNGDRVEILTSPNSKGPSRDWLNIVKSTQARTKINQWFRKQFKQEDIIRGKELLETCARQKGYVLSALSDSKCIENVCKRYGLRNWDAVCAAIGYGSIKEKQIIQRLIDENIKVKKIPITPQQFLDNHAPKENFNYEEEKQPKKSKSGIVVRGVGDVAVRFSKCCRPLPGDEIVGYITRGRGVSIHRQDCTNIIHMCEEEKERLIEAQWFNEEEISRTYITEIQITGSDRMGIILDISKILTDMKVPVKSLNARTTKNHEAIFNIRIEINHTYQLDELTRKVMQIQDVVEIQRVSS
ncbi:bifunctional (p)ppGpp synthetase/guanosine-3',5'-bis(diphosphate) 3'-pyrophosphohydrolase [Niameybacter massiliensis]|uniref:GTP diphosphokinase n=1 Tax=Holtiella tumoricola TaxID=3018743 RepID=A0AA42DM41_9FIRM|nr:MULTISPECIES: bifunctional (p)ppGpp synthetase/guanosine-3',5'-bis(diphosphate) 3'-pyrophosphohydrolase [Lachnospirales]MDA3731499.1 bifunctional (p)ppGpp synthetase/guanosine-3',5'-bis(diphosphate) 3'-pyrophosphohydrolase [Holtiella tumoricola]